MIHKYRNGLHFKEEEMKPMNRLVPFYCYDPSLPNEHCELLSFKFCNSNHSIQHSLFYPPLLNLPPTSLFSEILEMETQMHQSIWWWYLLYNCQRTMEKTDQQSVPCEQQEQSYPCDCASVSCSGPCESHWQLIRSAVALTPKGTLVGQRTALQCQQGWVAQTKVTGYYWRELNSPYKLSGQTEQWVVS